MSDMLAGLMKQLGGGDLLGKLAGNMGVDEATAEKGFEGSVSGLMDSVKQMTTTDEGKARLQGALDSADVNILDDPSSVLSGAGNGQETLDKVFGGGQDIAQKVAGTSGLPVDQIMKFLPVVLPLLMGFMKKFMSGKGMDMNGLAGMLAEGDKSGGFLSKLKSLFS